MLRATATSLLFRRVQGRALHSHQQRLASRSLTTCGIVAVGAGAGYYRHSYSQQRGDNGNNSAGQQFFNLSSRTKCERSSVQTEAATTAASSSSTTSSTTATSAITSSEPMTDVSTLAQQMLQELTQRSNDVFPEMNHDLSHATDLILPTFEAVVRASRLAKTAVIMAADYQFYFWERKFYLWYQEQLQKRQQQKQQSELTQMKTNPQNENSNPQFEGMKDNSSSENKMQQLEIEILQLEKALEQAQHDYVTEKPENRSAKNEHKRHPQTNDQDIHGTNDTSSSNPKDSTSKSINSNHANDSNNSDSTDPTTISERTLAKRAKKEAMWEIANQLARAQDELNQLQNKQQQNYNDDEHNDELDSNATNDSASANTNSSSSHNIHQRNALRLLNLCRLNGGTYIKVGQHLANLDLLLPTEYIDTLSSLFDDTPRSSITTVKQVIHQELGKHPHELWDNFDETPIASASLAQVHTAQCPTTGTKLAIKVQHGGLRETSKGDLFAMSLAVHLAEFIFREDFKFSWICEEIAPQLPKELDFRNEGRNAERASEHLRGTGLDVVVPRVLWDFTGERVLTMEFEEGFKVTDVRALEEAGICKREVAKLLSSVFHSQIFQNGFVHCDPHEANVLIRPLSRGSGKPQMVLIDHGLYKSLDDEFTEAYARLWKGIVMADVQGIKGACESLGVKTMYPLLAAMLTSRPFDEVIERSQTKSFDAPSTKPTTTNSKNNSSSNPTKQSNPNTGGDKAILRNYAQRYLKEIISMLDIVPRQMLLLFKMNDCLRHVDYALGSPANTMVVAGEYANRRVWESDWERRRKQGWVGYLRSWVSYVHVLLRIRGYELWNRMLLSR